MLILSSIEMRSEYMRLNLFCQETHYDNWKLNEPWGEISFRNPELPVFWVCLPNSTFRNTSVYISGMKTFCEGVDNKYSRLYLFTYFKVHSMPSVGLELRPHDQVICPYIFFSYTTFTKCKKLFLVLVQYKNGQLVWDQSLEGC